MDLAVLNSMLTDDIKEYAKSLYLDQRFSQPLNVQCYRRPSGFLSVVEYLDRYKDIFPDTVRASGSGTYNIYIDLQNTNDSLERLALWVEYLDLRTV